MTMIHPTAVINPNAKIGDNVSIGAYSVIYDDVTIGENTQIGPHVVVYDGARIGNNVKIFQGSSVSNLPQDLKFDKEKTQFIIGDNTVIREFTTLHRGTIDAGHSRIGKNCLLMAYSHVAHDVLIGDNCIIANGVQIGGHVEIDDWVIIGGTTPIHQFSKIGMHAMVGGGFRVIADVPPYVLAANEPLRYAGLNIIGLRRRGFKSNQVNDIKAAYNILFHSNLIKSKAIEEIAEKFPDNPEIKNILNFLEKSNRTLIKG